MLRAVPRAMLGHGPRHGQRYKAVSRSFRGDFRQILVIPGGFKASFGHFRVILGEFWTFLGDFRRVLVISGGLQVIFGHSWVISGEFCSFLRDFR